MKKTLFDYEQVFTPHGYMELSMLPTKSNEVRSVDIQIVKPATD